MNSSAAASGQRRLQRTIAVGCIGKCTSGLSLEDLDRITDHIHKTLSDDQGRKIFREYLRQAQRTDDLACLDFYEKCSNYIDEEENNHESIETGNLDFLIQRVNDALEIAEELYGVPEIDMAILERYTETLANPSRSTLLALLEDTRVRLMNHLRNAHRGFRTYALAPCPRTAPPASAN